MSSRAPTGSWSWGRRLGTLGDPSCSRGSLGRSLAPRRPRVDTWRGRPGPLRWGEKPWKETRATASYDALDMNSDDRTARTLVVDDPFTGEAVCTVALADEVTVNATLNAAQSAARAWRQSPIAERIALCERAVAAMEKRAPSIADDITRMMGKPIAQSLGEVKTCAARARYLIGIADQALAEVVKPAMTRFDRR